MISVIGSQKIPSALLDNSTKSLGIVAHQISISEPGLSTKVVLIKGRAEPRATEGKKRLQIESLPTIAQLTNDGQLSLFRNEELTLEAWRRKGSYPYQQGISVFENVRIGSIHSAVRRGITHPGIMDEYINGLQAFVEWLLDGGTSAILNNDAILRRLLPAEVNALAANKLAEICRTLPKRQYADAFHLWSAEVAELDYFLTADFKFMNGVRRDKKLELNCRIIAPSELLDNLGIESREPLPYEYGKLYPLFGRPYD